nr:hypothetical protein CFP56_24390 [Quercus suber]
MARMELLDLPQELLDEIYSYLDWDNSLDLEPQLDHLRVLSLVSKRMRESVIPLLFRTVTLALRWQDDVLVEPALFRLRRYCPELARYIRGVHICTRSLLTTAQHHFLPPFVVSGDVHDWLDPASTSWRNHNDWDSRIYNDHRECADAVALNLHNELPASYQVPDAASLRAEHLISHMVGESGRARELRLTTTHGHLDNTILRRDAGGISEQLDDSEAQGVPLAAKARIDALAIVLLCLPPTLNHLIVNSSFVFSVSDPQQEFVLHMMAMAIKLFANRIEDLSAAISARAMRRGRMIDNVNTGIISTELISSLRVIKSLTLAAHTKAPSQQTSTPRALLQDFRRWLSATSLHDLTICNVMIDSTSSLPGDSLLTLVSGFPALRHLRLRDILYLHPRPANNQPSRNNTWLELLIAIRRSQPDVHLELRNLSYGAKPGTNLPAGALKWFRQVLAPGSTVSLEREFRLTEDFESFLSMWEAEASERGVAAAEERKSGALVDLAMGTRGMQHNVRQDQGEWMEI